MPRRVTQRSESERHRFSDSLRGLGGVPITVMGGTPPYSYVPAGSPSNPAGVEVDAQGSTATVTVAVSTSLGTVIHVTVHDSGSPHLTKPADSKVECFSPGRTPSGCTVRGMRDEPTVSGPLVSAARGVARVQRGKRDLVRVVTGLEGGGPVLGGVWPLVR